MNIGHHEQFYHFTSSQQDVIQLDFVLSDAGL